MKVVNRKASLPQMDAASMKKIALSLTEQNVEWLNAEAAALIRCEEAILNEVLDVGFMFKAMLEVPEPAGENRCSYVLKPVREMTVAKTRLAFEQARRDLLGVTKRVNGLDNLLAMTRLKGLEADNTIGAMTQAAALHEVQPIIR
jgi:hypothetical protein